MFSWVGIIYMLLGALSSPYELLIFPYFDLTVIGAYKFFAWIKNMEE